MLISGYRAQGSLERSCIYCKYWQESYMKGKGSLRNTSKYLIVDVEQKRSANKEQCSGGFDLASSRDTAPNLVSYAGGWEGRRCG